MRGAAVRAKIEGSALKTTSKRTSVIPRLLRSRLRRGAHPGWMKFGVDPDPEDGYVYVTQYYSDTINQYRANNQNNDPPICEIPSKSRFPQGVKTDTVGTLYATEDVGVATFGPNCGAPGTTYADPENVSSDDVAIDGTTLYDSNLNGGDNPATIEVYALGDPHPSRQLSSPSVLTGIGLAVDSHHNLFWSAASQEFNDGFVVEFPEGSDAGIVLNSTRIGSDFPGGVIIDRTDNLLLVDQNSKSIYIYAPPYDAPAFSTIRLKGTTVDCAMGLLEKRLYCLDYEYGSVDIYAYPAGTYINSFTNGINAPYEPEGIAVQAPCPTLSRAKCGE